MIGLVIAGGLAYNVSGAERLGLVRSCFRIDFDWLRARDCSPAERVETLLLLLSWVATSSILMMHH